MKSLILGGTPFSGLKSSETFKAMDDVTFEVEQGEMIGIIGSNGAGKSTLLKILVGTTKPTSGTITSAGKISALIELGAGFHPEITGRENIFVNGIMLGLSKKEISEKYDEIVRFAELEDFIESPVKTYSSGMYMRLGFSVAINVNPDILLIDEVLAVGDEAFVHKCIDKINNFKRRKKTIVIVTHSLDVVATMCDRAIWLEKGKVEKIGEPKMVVGAYRLDVGRREEGELAERHAGRKLEIDAGPGDGKDRRRWGTREIEIEEVSLRDQTGEERFVYESGEPLNIVMKIKAKEKVEDFAFGIGIFSSEGVCCYGTNTQLENYQARMFSGTGSVTFRIDSLNLLDGTYSLDVAAHKKDGYPYDYHRSICTFRMTSDCGDTGIFRPAHVWDFSRGIEWE